MAVFLRSAASIFKNAKVPSALAAVRQHSSGGQYQHILVEKKGKKRNVGFIQLNRPKAKNALTDGLMLELSKALNIFEQDAEVGAVVLTGSATAFATDADITERQQRTFKELILGKPLLHWNRVLTTTNPVIAAVNGLALGGGCELALQCDIIYAGKKAQFGHPEILMGTFPSSAVIQRLSRAAGKSLAKQIILTGQPITAYKAKQSGLITKVVPVDQVVTEAVRCAEKIANNSKLVSAAVKEALSAGH